jgi:hypothetical protein
MEHFGAISCTVAFINVDFDISELNYGRSILKPDYERLGKFKVSKVIRGGSEQSWYILYTC